MSTTDTHGSVQMPNENKVLSLVPKDTKNNKKEQILEMLQDTIERVESDEIDFEKLLLVHLNDKNDGYELLIQACNMRSSELITLFEVCKAEALARM
tara:strand:- start:576 stop:866 length:291 start_codon:yes stop_codon:yes gene_type:complete